MSVVALLAALQATPAGLAPPAAPERQWLRRPTAARFVDAYPTDAFRRELGGTVLLSCKVRPDGSLSPCVVVREIPVGLGFGAATLTMAAGFRVKGEPGETIVFPMKWMLEGRAVPDLPDTLGDPAYVLVPEAPRPSAPSVRCPSREAPDRRCSVHALSWTSRPRQEVARKLVQAAGEDENVSVALCSLAVDNSLTDCTLDAKTTAAESAVLEQLFAGLRAPATADPKTPTAGRRILVQIDWPVLRAYAADKRHKLKGE